MEFDGMGFDNDYPNRKDHIKKYYDSRRVDRTCRCNGSCAYCQNNRTYNTRKKLEQFEDYNYETGE